MPQSIKDIIASGDYGNLLQIISMLIFIIIFLVVVWFVLSKPEKYYNDEEHAPLDDDHNQKNV